MILNRIIEHTKARIAAQKREAPLETLRARAESTKLAESRLDSSGQNLGRFERALRKDSRLSFICEVKKASPSKGIIHERFPYLDIAQAYERAGADAISCLTEPEFFLGSDEYFTQIREQVAIPMLRKDFTIDPYMIYQAKCMGADAVLLIVSALDSAQLRDFYQLSSELGLCALVETHDEKEIERALEIGARIIGVNNRNLRTFEVDMGLSLRLRALVPSEIVFISESGISSQQDLARLREHGVNGVLIGEWFMKEGAQIKN